MLLSTSSVGCQRGCWPEVISDKAWFFYRIASKLPDASHSSPRLLACLREGDPEKKVSHVSLKPASNCCPSSDEKWEQRYLTVV